MILGIVVLGGIAYAVGGDPIDFRVYYLGSQGLVEGSRPVYGVWSGAGWPLHYRYPPLFLLLFFPFTLVPFRVGAAIWLVGKVVVMGFLVRGIWRRMDPEPGLRAILIPALIVIPYLLLDLQYGNVQLFIVALTAASMFALDSHPWRAASALALAISIKVWPLVFVPYLVAARRYKVAGATLVMAGALTLTPALYLGATRTVDLLAEWANQEFVTQAGQAEMWFPSQSLRGVMTRYLTEVDYSVVPDANYPAIHQADLGNRTVIRLSLALSAAIYVLFLGVVRARGDHLLISAALAFCLVALIEPHTQRHALVLLLWPALVAGRLRAPATRWLVLIATALVALQPLLPGAALQRLSQTLGADFTGVVLLAIAFAIALVRGRGLSPRPVEGT